MGRNVRHLHIKQGKKLTTEKIGFDSSDKKAMFEKR